MKKIDNLLGTVRIAIFSLLGLLQFILVVFGCFYLSDLLMEAYPFAKYIRHTSPVVGLFTLVYPVYILIAIKTQNPRMDLKKKQI